MILHSDREGNDCIRKLRCHCIQILHSDIYSVKSSGFHQVFDPIVHTGQLGCYRLYLKLSFACRQQSLATSPSTPLFNSCKELQIVQVLTNILNSSDLKNIHNYTSIYTRSLYNANSLSAKFNMCLYL